MQYEIEVVSKDGTFEILFDTGDFLGSVTTCYLLGYNEGRLTAGSVLGG
ncbi:MAG: hypothetical protein GWN12_02605 [Thermoplasmata archaeon]|nr:hypothetical protein [Thermoplasmata archaeon]NIS18839.1 hypothetical protein [Thermoplasmata archaeon]NIW87686.1 hypothetical protein [Thermoplasmata archaeon]